MIVKERMSKNLLTITKEDKIDKAIDIMTSHGLHRLPVVEGKQLVGLLTEGMISQRGASKATSLSIFELNYLLSKTSVETIMEKHVHTIYENQFIEDAAVKMLEYNIGCLLVLDEKDELVGIITQNDLFKSFIEILGYHDKGTRLSVEVVDGLGVLEKITKIIGKYNCNILHIGVYDGEDGKTNIIFRIDSLDTDGIKSELEENGYKVLNITKNEV
ncbi:acetoin utilization protein AcuB [Breznakia sp. PF5-3]|uniref:CBS and ACT domain-containing protein n=1 Tax=unclassified Breznakia TaxID=2623764 RepID=UPI0024049EE2|nr:MULTISPECIES: CBS and ACT domain-containing protein [unclassified Breznakia]MDF9824589.1 acetoin utilization protein AcuB [Breznakia sp. PM6-1]MDF9835479.1 acetoin utilization protein AcuB [Breznakia sp. PF5-3]MDF9837889.1 acetoin utilization protein AcuB [Breznakia sp. PFB2-8]MDF9859818.1 acetoin utilization protein AcuB [Breznakia sp. PH5-24]